MLNCHPLFVAMADIPGVRVLKCDISSPLAQQLIKDILGERKADVIMRYVVPRH